MAYYLIAMVIVAILLIIVVWYLTGRYYSDTIIVDLSGTEDKLLSEWYEAQIRNTSSSLQTESLQTESLQTESLQTESLQTESLQTESLSTEPSKEVIAGLILSELYNIDVEPAVLVLGTNLATEYHKLTGKRLVIGDNLFTLRDILAIPLDIAIVRNAKIRRVLQSKECDIAQLRAILHHRLHEQAVPYLKKVLDHRWSKLLELADSRIINNSGSYVDLRSNDEQVLHNIIGQRVNDTVRLNLLCSDREFDLLLRRWRRYVKGSLPLPSRF